MKKFRLFACLAALATFTTVFAAWELNNYANSYQDEAMLRTTVVTDIENKEALTVEITNSPMATVIFDEGAATVSEDINVKVTANITEDDINNYDFYYTLYTGVAVDELSDIPVYTPDGSVPATSVMNELAVDAEGNATIARGEMEVALQPEIEVSADNLAAFEDHLEESKAALDDEGHIGVLVYAVKKADLECGAAGHTSGGTCPACGSYKGGDLDFGDFDPNDQIGGEDDMGDLT